MASIRTKNTRPELLVRSALFSKGFRFRVNVKSLPGAPDIVLKQFKTVIFVHGCFWHGHRSCKRSITSSTNKEFWEGKIQENRARDNRVELLLTLNEWKVEVIWECELSSRKKIENRMKSVIDKILASN